MAPNKCNTRTNILFYVLVFSATAVSLCTENKGAHAFWWKINEFNFIKLNFAQAKLSCYGKKIILFSDGNRDQLVFPENQKQLGKIGSPDSVSRLRAKIFNDFQLPFLALRT